MTNHQLAGAWKLVAWEVKDAQGKVSYPFGPRPVGYLLYTQDGFMAGNIMDTSRPQLGATREGMAQPRGRFALLSPTYLKVLLRWFAATTKYVAYSGRYEIVGDKIIHHVEMDLIPDSAGTVRERLFTLEGDRLTLAIPPLGGSTNTLVWQRCAPEK